MADKIYEDVNEGVLRHVGRGGKILDVGCGIGTLGLEVRRRGNVVWGLDVSENGIEFSSEKLDKAFVCDVTEIESLPIKDERFDTIIFADVLEHLDEPGNVLGEYKRFLREGGRVIVSLPNIASWTIRVKRLFGPLKPSKYGILDETHKHFYDLKKAKKLVEEAGYNIIEVDANPNITRAFIPAARNLARIISPGREDPELNRRIIDSKAYRAYRIIVLPVELLVTRLWKNLLAFQFIIVCEKA